MNYEESIQDIKTAKYCCRKIIRINQDIEVLEHQMTGLARSGPVLSPQQARSPLPLPHYHHNPDASPVALIEACEAKRRERAHYVLQLAHACWIEKLPLDEQQMLTAVYYEGQHYADVAKEHGYSKKGMYKHLRGAIEKL